MSQMAKVFGGKWQEFSWRRGAILAVVLGPLIIVGVLPHDRRYFLSAIFGALFLALVDPGGKYEPRVARMAIFGARSRGPGRMSKPGSRRPGARHTAPAMAGITITTASARTADRGTADRHGRNPASRASSLALTSSVHVEGAA